MLIHNRSDRTFYRLTSLVAFLICVANGVPALANGAFPAPFRVFAPAGRPETMIVTTNFGIIETADSGKVWSWVCEHGVADSGYLYQLAPAPSRRLLAFGLGVNGTALVFTDDGGCSWSESRGLPDDGVVMDFFVDPGSQQQVLAVVRRNVAGAFAFSLMRSMDEGTSFQEAPLYVSPPGTSLDSVEVSLSDPNRIYATLSAVRPDGTGPRVIRSDDGARSFVPVSTMETGTTTGIMRIATVDRVDANRVYFRFESADANEDRMLVSTNGGQTLTTLLTPPPGATLSAFLQRTDGTLFVSATDTTGRGLLYRSGDNGASFALISDKLHVGSLVERATVLYALGDGIQDPFLVAASNDNGASFQKLMGFSDVKGVKNCPNDLRPTCRTVCTTLSDSQVFAPPLCEALAVDTGPTDAGGADRPGDGSGPSGAGEKAGCSCSSAGEAPSLPVSGSALAAALAAVGLLRRQRRAGRAQRIPTARR